MAKSNLFQRSSVLFVRLASESNRLQDLFLQNPAATGCDQDTRIDLSVRVSF